MTAVVGRFIEATAGTDEDAFDIDASSRERLVVRLILRFGAADDVNLDVETEELPLFSKHRWMSLANSTLCTALI